METVAVETRKSLADTARYDVTDDVNNNMTCALNEHIWKKKKKKKRHSNVLPLSSSNSRAHTHTHSSDPTTTQVGKHFVLLLRNHGNTLLSQQYVKSCFRVGRSQR